MPLDQDTKVRLGMAEAFMRDQLEEKLVDADGYAKLMLILASDYARNGAHADVIRIVEKFPADYYRGAMVAQCNEQPSFLAALHDMASKLVDDGIVDVGPRYHLTMRPAEA